MMAGTPPEASAPVADPHQQELDLWDEAIRIDPTDGQAYLLRGDVYERAGRQEEALADFAQATALEPDNRSFRKHRAELLNRRAIERKKKGDLDGAIADYSEAIRLLPDSAGIHRNRAKTYIVQKDYERAFADLDKAYALAPDNWAVCNDLAWHRATVNDERYRDPRRALELATRACQIKSHEDPNALGTLAAVHAALGDFDEAMRLIDQAISKTDIDPHLRMELEKNRESFLQRTPVFT